MSSTDRQSVSAGSPTYLSKAARTTASHAGISDAARSLGALSSFRSRPAAHGVTAGRNSTSTNSSRDGGWLPDATSWARYCRSASWNRRMWSTANELQTGRGMTSTARLLARLATTGGPSAGAPPKPPPPGAGPEGAGCRGTPGPPGAPAPAPAPAPPPPGCILGRLSTGGVPGRSVGAGRAGVATERVAPPVGLSSLARTGKDPVSPTPIGQRTRHTHKHQRVSARNHNDECSARSAPPTHKNTEHKELHAHVQFTVEGTPTRMSPTDEQKTLAQRIN